MGAALTLPELRCELIADGVRVHPAAMPVLFDAAETERLVLVTDAAQPTGLPDGECALDRRGGQRRRRGPQGDDRGRPGRGTSCCCTATP